VQRLHTLWWTDLLRLDQPQPHGGRQAVVMFLRWTADLDLAIPQFHHRGAFGPSRIARRQFDHAPPHHRERRRRGEQRAPAGQQAVLHRSAQQVEVCLWHRRPTGVNVGLAVGDHGHPRIASGAGFRRGRLSRQTAAPVRRCRRAANRTRVASNFFAKIKQFRAIATRCETTARNFLAAVQLVASVVWLN
jgi:transposase